MSSGIITMTGAEYDALAGRIAALEAENAKLKGEYEWVASINTALDESNQSAWAENAKLRAELAAFKSAVDHVTADGKTTRSFSASEGWAMVHMDRLTDLHVVEERLSELERRAVPDVSAMARVLSDRAASACCVDPDDNWKMYGQEFIDDVRAMLAAAPSAPATVQGGGWIPVSERLPESERTVLAFYLNSHGKGRRVRAEYIAAKTKSADDGWDSDEPADYDEQADEYFWPADWYEVMDNWDDLTHMVIHEGEVTHWMPLPPAPEVV